ncbi:MAG TPA: T9SS type A sorting domain-containing protein, partial [Prolixibacteraceae bacterium]|nr:T9SS type A sorting domain-containing protein [Prolixibacteraceae bacterium]
FENKSYSYNTETPDSFIWVLSQKDTIFNANPDYTFKSEGWHSIELIAHNGSMFDHELKYKHIYTFSIDTFFVDVEGSDTLGNGSPDSPFRSIQHAVDLARKNDVVIVNPGTYYEQVKLEGEEFVLASRYLLNNDTSFISQTIIDGSNERENVLTVANRATEETRIVGLTFQNAYQTSESSIKHGAGIFCDKSSPTISNCIIRNNTAYFRGGGLYLYESESLVENCFVYRNKTSRNISQGGGIAVFRGEPRFESIHVVDNSACKFGGGMFFLLSDVTIEHSKIMYNVVTDSTSAGSGGGVCYFDGHLFIDNSRIQSNTASNRGGGLFLEKVKATIANSYFGKNKVGQIDSTGQGGAVYIRDSKPDEASQIKRTVFEANIAQNEGGAIYCGDDAEIELHGLTVINNISINNNSGAVYVNKNANAKIYSSVLWGNQPEQIGLAEAVDSTQVIEYSSIQGGFKGKNNTDLYPMFVDTTSSNLNLKIQSPCIDTGSPLSDADPDGSVADMGAFYYDQTYPEFIDTLNNFTFCDNDILNIAANVRGAGRLYFEWYKDGWLFLEGNPLYLNNISPEHSGEFYCVVKNKKRDIATSNRFKIDVLPSSKVVVDTTISEGEGFFAEGELQHATGSYTDKFTNVQGCDSTVIVNLTVENFVDVNDFNNDINVYPNPTKRHLFIESDSFKNAVFYDIKGNRVESFYTTNIDLGKMSKGIYFLMITELNDSQHWMKIILTD